MSSQGFWADDTIGAIVSAKKRRDQSGEWLAGESEARATVRRSLNTILITNPVPGQVIDMSASGMGLESREAIKSLGESLFTLASGSTRAQVLGEVRWSKLSGTKQMPNGEVAPLYRTGIAFRDDISGFLTRNGPQVDRRI